MCTCYQCQSNDVAQLTESEKYQYKNTEYKVDIDYSVCRACDEEFLITEQILINEKRIREAKKKIDGLLSADEIRDIRKQLHLTQADAVLLFGGGKNAFSKYERSEVTQSVSMDKLLRLASTDNYFFKELCHLSNMTDKVQFITLKDIPKIMTTKKSQWSNDNFNIINDKKINTQSNPIHLNLVA